MTSRNRRLFFELLDVVMDMNHKRFRFGSVSWSAEFASRTLTRLLVVYKPCYAGYSVQRRDRGRQSLMRLRWFLHFSKMSVRASIRAASIRSLAFSAARRILGRRVASHVQFRAKVENKFGLEIGGPSGIFLDSGALPLYHYVGGLDNCVFAGETVWEGARAEGQTYSYHPRKPKGFNFIREATELTEIADHAYDFILSSHNLEHIANPIKALKEWVRVVRPGGAIIVILPDYRRTFDHRRRPTSLEHMVRDYASGTNESDQTHLQEILELHDLSRDPKAGTFEQFRTRSLHNIQNRCLHHHIFDEHNSRALLEAAGLSVGVVEVIKPHHIVLLSFCDARLMLGHAGDAALIAGDPDC